MQSNSVRRTAALAAIAALPAGLLTVSTGVATADSPTTCNQASHDTKSG
ncbi:hypothetical protein ACFV4K_29695 [Nocardia sp. NPDC059764]